MRAFPLKLSSLSIVTTALLLASSLCLAQTPASPQALAERALMLGRIDTAIDQLQPLLSTNPRDPAVHLLLCRSFYAEDHVDEAVSHCEAAIANGLARDSVAQDWMGRVYGRKADISGPFTGLKLAHRVKDAFEAAVNLDPHNADALDDLAQYYLEAPGIVGGGLDRARALATRVAPVLPARARRLRALVAEKQKDTPTAERELRALAEATSSHADGWLDLAAFFERNKDYEQATATVKRSIAANTRRDPSLYFSALLLIKMRREPALAQQALRSYLSGGALEDGAPAFKAHEHLGRLLAAAGDKPAAQAEYRAALALAANFAPARKALAQ